MIPFVRTITENNSITNISPPEGVDGFSEGTVMVNIQGRYSEIEEEYTANGTYDIVKTSDIDGFSGGRITVNVPSESNVNNTTFTQTLSSNGQWSLPAAPSPYTGYSSGTVNVQVPLPSIESNFTDSISSNGNYSIIPSTGYDAISGGTLSVNVPQATLQSDFYREYNSNGYKQINPGQGYDGISGGSVYVNVTGETKNYGTISSNGPVTIRPSEGYDLMELVNLNVNVPRNMQNITIPTITHLNTGGVISAPDLPYTGYGNIIYSSNIPVESKNYGTISTNGQVTITPSSGYECMDEVTLNVNVPTSTLETVRIPNVYNSNGQFDVYPSSGYDGMQRVIVDIDVPNSPYKMDGIEVYDPNSDGIPIVLDHTNFTRMTSSSLNNISIDFDYTGSSKNNLVIAIPVQRYSNGSCLVGEHLAIVNNQTGTRTVSITFNSSYKWKSDYTITMLVWKLAVSNLTTSKLMDASVVYYDKSDSSKKPLIEFNIDYYTQTTASSYSAEGAAILYSSVFDYSSIFY